MSEFQEIPIDKNALKGDGISSQILQEIAPPNGPEDGYLVIFVDDLVKGSRKEKRFIVKSNVFEGIRNLDIHAAPRNERAVTEGEFLETLDQLLGKEDVSWISTDTVSYDWSDINEKGVWRIIDDLRTKGVKRARIGIAKEDGRDEYLTFKINE